MSLKFLGNAVFSHAESLLQPTVHAGFIFNALCIIGAYLIFHFNVRRKRRL